MNAAFFAIAATRKTDVVTDLSYSLSFALLAIVLPFAGSHEPVQLTASLLVLIWAARLGGYLFRRILRIEVDHRFDDMRDNPLRFARFWLLQAISVAVIMLPVCGAFVAAMVRDHPRRPRRSGTSPEERRGPRVQRRASASHGRALGRT